MYSDSGHLYYEIGIFYFVLGNLHPKYRSKLKFIQLIAVCKQWYIEKYTMNAVLRPLIENLNKFVSKNCIHIACST